MMKTFFALFFHWSVVSLLVLSTVPVTARPVAVRQDNPLAALLAYFTEFINGIDSNILNNASDIIPSPKGKYRITQDANRPARRAAKIEARRSNFLYGPPVAGGPSFPNGSYGEQRVALDQAYLKNDLIPELGLAVQDAMDAAAGISKYDGLQTLRDYTKLYDGEWQRTLPTGPDPGIETNYTEDLLFSMERLSFSPYQVRRLIPGSDICAFKVDDTTAKAVSGQTLSELLHAGRLFYADYRDQNQLIRTAMYSGAVDAFFYIHKRSGKFLPLAIRTNFGSDLIYTPMDTRKDWMLAKMMYNVNDFWFSQWNHLAGTHEVVQIAYMAAIRTLSEDHPVLGMLNRLMFEVFAIQPLAEIILFTPGAAVDEIFAFTGPSAQNYTTERYFNRGAGRFQANYLYTDLENRGLINCNFGPELERFPFAEDAATIYNAIHRFFHSFVNSYYSSDAVIKADKEIQAWAKEANGPAKAIDFPKHFTKANLVDVLSHFAHLASTAHHTANTNELLQVASTLPFHPPSLYQPLPTSKGISTSLATWEPPFVKAIEQFAIAALFARPLLVNTNRTLLHMFDDPVLLSKLNDQTTNAAARFKSKMTAFSAEVSARTFDADGLSQGMPFVWRALDPNVQPYSITI